MLSETYRDKSPKLISLENVKAFKVLSLFRKSPLMNTTRIVETNAHAFCISKDIQNLAWAVSIISSVGMGIPLNR